MKSAFFFKRRFLAAGASMLIGASALIAGMAAEADSEAEPRTEPLDVLVFSKTAGFRHGNIEKGVQTLDALGKEYGYRTVATEDSAHFNAEHLAKYDVVIFMSTTGDILNSEQQQAFEGFIQNGGGFVGIHAATDTEYGWPWFVKLVGANFAGHPKVQHAVMDVVDREHLSTNFLSAEWGRTDEWYDFKKYNPDVNLLLKLDETTYEDGKMGSFHPAAWYHEYDGGRSWYTAGGHTHASFDEPNFQRHVLGGIFWAAGKAEVPGYDDSRLTEPDASDPAPIGGIALKPLPKDLQGAVYAFGATQTSNTKTEACKEGGENVGFIKNGSLLAFSGVDLSKAATKFEARVATSTQGGKIEIRKGGSGGELLGTCVVPRTGGWQNWTTVTADVQLPEGSHDVTLLFRGGGGFLFNIHWFRFQ